MLRTFEHLISCGFDTRLSTAVEDVSYYDFVLAVIPAVFLVAAVVGQAMSMPSQTIITGASVLAALAVLDALFLNPPSDDA